ncbi:MAG TPA: NAD(P)-dependent oxidoreductase, partial [Acetobacteraceae bacterium]|nr:NAD(P)-dependent oxidoreductase [Acetobacteraceae bacterium]
TSLARELKVPTRLCQLVLEEFNEALGRGWGERDSRATMLMQNERAGVSVTCDRIAVQAVLDADMAR